MRPVLLVAEPAVFHVEALEHRRVELLAGAVVGLPVGVAAARGEGRRQLQDLLPLAEIGVELGEPVPGDLDVGTDARLLGLEGRHVDGARVVRVEELAPLGLGLGKPAGEQLALGGIGALAFDDLGRHLLMQPLGPRGRQLDALVQLFDLGFEVLGCDVALPARAGRVVLLAEAEEVGVAALGVLDRQAPSADAAMQQTLQVVRVLALAGAPCSARGEQLLDPAEGLGIDERFVGAGMLDAVPLDDPDVHRVGEDLGQALPGDSLGRPVAPGPVGEPAVGQLSRQALEGPLTRRLVEFTPTGHVVNSWTIYVTPAGPATAPDGSVLVANYGSFAVDRIVNDQNTALTTFKLNSLAGLAGAFRPSGVAVTSAGQVYADTDGVNGGTNQPAVAAISAGGQTKLLAAGSASH